MLLYVPHAGNLFMRLEHIDMTFSGYSFLNWLYGIALAGIIEFLILVVLINGYRTTGKFYAIVSFFLNVFYYYWFVSAQEPSVREEKSEFTCAECDMIFMNKKSLEGHLPKVHRTEKKQAELNL